MVDLILKGLLFLSPLAYGTNIPLDLFDMIFFRTGTLVLFIASLWDKPARELDKNFKIIVTSLMSIGFINIFIHTFRADVMTNYLNLFFAVMALSIIVTRCKDIQGLKKWMIYAAIANIGVFLFQRIGINPILNTPGSLDTQGGIIGSSPRLAIYLALIAPLNIWFALAAGVISLITTTRDFSLTAVVWLVILYKLHKKREKILWVIAAGLGVILFKDRLLSSFLMRWNNVWHPAIFEFCKRPLLGFGLGKMPVKAEVMFNSYLQFICGVGIAGLAWLFYVLREYRKEIIKSVSMLSLLLLMFIEYPIEIPRLWFMVIVLVGFFIIKIKGGIDGVDKSSL